MRMYVWYPKSMSDHTNGVVCVIAESKVEAVCLAVDERYPLASCARGMPPSARAAVVRANQGILSDRAAFHAELMQDKPRVVRRGAVIEFGGG